MPTDRTAWNAAVDRVLQDLRDLYPADDSTITEAGKLAHAPEPECIAPVGEPVIDVAAVVALGRCLYALTDPSGRGGDYEIGYEAGTLAAVAEVRRLIAAYDPENPALRDTPYATP